ncbi:MAG: ATP-binding protein [Erysipelotrichaceae bacterium]|nr:ATP-binding protein [Erysipelotrichaceae bacterium]
MIKGNSGTGKTTLIRMLQGYLAQGNKSGITVKNDTNIPLMVFTSFTKWEKDLLEIKEHIIFVDYIYSRGFQQEFIKSDNYLVVISRSGKFNHLPYAVSSIYELRTETDEKIKLTRMYQMYTYSKDTSLPPKIITEDTNSGSQKMENIYHTQVVCVGGNGNVLKELVKYVSTQSTLFVIVDGAAFGGFISLVMNIAKLNNYIFVFAPESFECLLLQTNQLKRKLSDELENTWNYCDISQ